jgi:hypothetical protein
MPKFKVEFSNYATIIPEQGLDFPSVEAARKRAMEIAERLRADDMFMSGSNFSDWHMTIYHRGRHDGCRISVGRARKYLDMTIRTDAAWGELSRLSGPTADTPAQVSTKNNGGTRSWCPWRESNPHALRRTILSRVRLPVPPHGLAGQSI